MSAPPGIGERLNLPVLGDRGRCATPKSQITPHVIAKEEKRQKKKANADTFRKAVWARDKGICRATRVALSKSGSDPHRVGEVDHVLNRSTHPDRIYDVSNGILISRFLNHKKKQACPRAPEHFLFEITGPDDRGERQTFTWRDLDGKVAKTRIG